MIRQQGKSLLFLIVAVVLGQLASSVPATAHAAMAMDHMACGQDHHVQDHHVQGHQGQNHQAQHPSSPTASMSELCCDLTEGTPSASLGEPTVVPMSADVACYDACMTFCIALHAALPLPDSTVRTFATPSAPHRPDMDDPTAYISDFISPPPKA